MTHTQPPGNYTIDKAEIPVCRAIMFDHAKSNEFNYPQFKPNNIELECFNDKAQGVKWLHFTDFKNEAFLEELKKFYKLHSLTIEDIVRGGQRSKHESFDDYDVIFMQVFKSSSPTEKTQLSVIFNDHVVLSFAEKSEDVADIVNSLFNRIKEGSGRVRRKGADYLAYCIADSVVDSYFTMIDDMEAAIELTDDEISKDPSDKVLQQVHSLKKEMLSFKKAVWPLREMVNSMQKTDSKFIKKDTIVFVRDLYDHTVRIAEATESLRDVTYGLIDLYMSSTGMKMNQAMKVLTVISTIFVPITFITSVYGMNFDGINELHFPYAYAIVWLVMISIAAYLLFLFKKKKWL